MHASDSSSVPKPLPCLPLKQVYASLTDGMCIGVCVSVVVVGVGALCTLGSAYVESYSQLRALRVLAG